MVGPNFRVGKKIGCGNFGELRLGEPHVFALGGLGREKQAPPCASAGRLWGPGGPLASPGTLASSAPARHVAGCLSTGTERLGPALTAGVGACRANTGPPHPSPRLPRVQDRQAPSPGCGARAGWWWTPQLPPAGATLLPRSSVHAGSGGILGPVLARWQQPEQCRSAPGGCAGPRRGPHGLKPCLQVAARVLLHLASRSVWFPEFPCHRVFGRTGPCLPLKDPWLHPDSVRCERGFPERRPPATDGRFISAESRQAPRPVPVPVPVRETPSGRLRALRVSRAQWG